MIVQEKEYKDLCVNLQAKLAHICYLSGDFEHFFYVMHA